MRTLALAALLLAGCPGGDGKCEVDNDCSGADVCARNGECSAASDVRTIHVTWTINGAAANATNCARTPNFYILFGSFQQNDTYGYEPVPCASGLFTIDKLPRRYTSVEVGVDRGFSQQGVFDTQGNATFDLRP